MLQFGRGVDATLWHVMLRVLHMVTAPHPPRDSAPDSSTPPTMSKTPGKQTTKPKLVQHTLAFGSSLRVGGALGRSPLEATVATVRTALTEAAAESVRAVAEAASEKAIKVKMEPRGCFDPARPECPRSLRARIWAHQEPEPEEEGDDDDDERKLMYLPLAISPREAKSPDSEANDNGSVFSALSEAPSVDESINSDMGWF